MNTPRVKEILSWYGSDNPGTLSNLARMLNHGKLGGSGRMVILPVDQGFEHGPARDFAGEIPLILKINNHDVLNDEKDPLSAVTSGVQDALRLGCAAIGFTIYPGSAERVTMYQQLREGGALG